MVETRAPLQRIEGLGVRLVQCECGWADSCVTEVFQSKDKCYVFTTASHRPIVSPVKACCYLQSMILTDTEIDLSTRIFLNRLLCCSNIIFYDVGFDSVFLGACPGCQQRPDLKCAGLKRTAPLTYSNYWRTGSGVSPYKADSKCALIHSLLSSCHIPTAASVKYQL